MSTKIFSILFTFCVIDAVFSGVAPPIPNKDRAEFYLLKNDGAYSYGYDTAKGSFGTQSGSKDNEVQGSYTYNNNNGDLVSVKYTSGVGGFMPETGEGAVVRKVPDNTYLPPVQTKESVVVERVELKPKWDDGSYSENNQKNDASYSFEYNTGDSSRQESSDSEGNVRGRYSYENEDGTHDISYVAGAETGFVPTGGSLAKANGLSDAVNARKSSWKSGGSWGQQNVLVKTPVVAPVVASWSSQGSSAVKSADVANDGSYTINYDAGDHSRYETGKNGFVKGNYAFTNEAGRHDLSYEAGPEIGFKVLGGSLKTANGLSDAVNTKNAQQWSTKSGQSSWTGSQPSGSGSWSSQGSSAVLVKSPEVANDGSYTIDFDAGDHSRFETGRNGFVKGNYAFTNEAGRHDLSYEAGPEIGFKVLSGSLKTANGLSDAFNARSAQQGSWKSTGNQPSGAGGSWEGQSVLVKSPSSTPVATNDGSYTINYNAGDHSRFETGKNGFVKGSYAYTNDAGSHDLSYEAGPEIGFRVLGGSLKPSEAVNGVTAQSLTKSHVQSGQSGGVRSVFSGTTAIHGGSSSSGEEAIAGRSVKLRTGSGSIGTKWLPVPENYKTGYYFTQTSY